MKIEVTDNLVDQVAVLARIALDESGRDELKEHFRKILDYIGELQEPP